MRWTIMLRYVDSCGYGLLDCVIWTAVCWCVCRWRLATLDLQYGRQGPHLTLFEETSPLHLAVVGESSSSLISSCCEALWRCVSLLYK